MSGIFESHAHYDSDRFDEDRKELLSRKLPQAGIETAINVASDAKSLYSTVNLTDEYDYIYGALGVHPSDLDSMEEQDWVYLREHLSDPKIVAIGEIGLDYYWEKDPSRRKRQKEEFKDQLDLARCADLPVIIHSRDAAEDTYPILEGAARKGNRGVIHCYSYSADQAEDYVKMGYYIGVGGVLTFTNGRKLKETVERIPLERILLETDCPYMAPEPHRGQRNDSAYLPLVAKEIARIKNVSYDNVISQTRENARKLFTKVERYEAQRGNVGTSWSA